MYKLAHTLSQNARTHLFTKCILKLDGVISCHANGISTVGRVATNSLHHNHASHNQIQHQCSEKFDVCVYQIPPSQRENPESSPTLLQLRLCKSPPSKFYNFITIPNDLRGVSDCFRSVLYLEDSSFRREDSCIHIILVALGKRNDMSYSWSAHLCRTIPWEKKWKLKTRSVGSFTSKNGRI